MNESRPGEWVLLLYCAPGARPETTGLLLRDCWTDQLYTRCRPSWWTQSACDEDVDLVHAFIADLEYQSLTTGGEHLLTFLEDTASHALQISNRNPVQIDSTPEHTLNRLYEQHIGENETEFGKSPLVSLPQALLRSQPRQWHQVGSFATAALVLLTIAPSLSTGPALSRPTSAISVGGEMLELPIASAPRRDFSLDDYINSVNAQGVPKTKARLQRHRQFSIPPVAVRPRYVQVAQLMPANVAVPASTAPALVPPPALEAPPFRSRRGALARLVSAVGIPFKALVKH